MMPNGATETLTTDEARHARLLSPDCESEDWWFLAELFPLVALRSPLFGILTLEEPRRWLDLEERRAGLWAQNWVDKIPKDSEPIFISRCVQRVIPNLLAMDYLIEKWAKIRVGVLTGHTPREASEAAARKARGHHTRMMRGYSVSAPYWAGLVVAALTPDEALRATTTLADHLDTKEAWNNRWDSNNRLTTNKWLWDLVRSFLPSNL